MAEHPVDSALDAWARRQSPPITGDPLWRLLCYREALYVLELMREDLSAGHAGTGNATAAQLLRSVGSVVANIGEGYGRPTTADRVRFFSYALGSTRESIAWLHALIPGLDASRLRDRIDRLARIRRMLLALLTRMRTRSGRRFDSW